MRRGNDTPRGRPPEHVHPATGERVSLRQLAAEAGVAVNTIKLRKRRGIPVLATPAEAHQMGKARAHAVRALARWRAS